MQAGVGLLILDVMPMYWSLPGYRRNYLRFYQLPNSNLFTHRLLSFSREATSEIYAPLVFVLIYLLAIYFSFAFLFRSIKPKIQKYFAALYFICNLLFQSTTNFWHRYPKGIDNPFNMSGCEVLVFVCKCCLHHRRGYGVDVEALRDRIPLQQIAGKGHNMGSHGCRRLRRWN